MKWISIVPVALAVPLLWSGLASAQITQDPTHVASPRSASFYEPWLFAEDQSSYQVEFGADELDATLEDGSIPRITVRPAHGYGLLTRPRTHFVPELLKSIEFM